MGKVIGKQGRIANAMRDFMAFHDASELIIERSDPVDFGTRLLKAM